MLLNKNLIFLTAQSFPKSLFPAKDDVNSRIAKLWDLLQDPFIQIYIQLQQLYQVWKKCDSPGHPLRQLVPPIAKQIQKYPQYQNLFLQIASSPPTIASLENILSQISEISSFRIGDTTHSVLLDSFKLLDGSWTLSPGLQTSSVTIEAVSDHSHSSVKDLLEWVSSCVGVPGIPISISLSESSSQHD